ncbi:YafY family protein [Frigidibacter sp. RF13]|uniref:helix-turn-helix transcriptional regulator n=1 Tax=Frigidibacter sp. RF13 TaxID=2997340 RepID=UPI002270364F|nr:YafY family protein [Frigidibacter sp. RF13]MCY1126275.1 YafY family protein [Frigidibacter sp. RF13]
MRSDRLFDLIQILRDGKLHRAADLAARLEVSTRTIWRDMATLQASGLPVEGERGVGYMLTAPVTLPPVALTLQEMEALRLGIALVASAADAGLSYAAHTLGQKIAAVSPAAGNLPPVDTFVFAGPEAQKAAPHLPKLRAAISSAEKLDMTYRDLAGRESLRRIRPLQLEYWGRVWTATAWCERRKDFRTFRVDLMLALTPTGETFVAEPGKTLADFKARPMPSSSP